ncbi:MAG: alpha/beta hydrolase [Deltaproteobacteria bacterium]|nr:alpha/beta hydrolase [Deltaproteobacteria bacterium]
MGVVVKGVVEKDVVIDGVRLHYAEAGQSGAPAVVLVPGQSMPWESYCKVIPLLADRFHVFALDVRGHGKSAHTPGGYTFSRCGKDLVEFLRVVVGGPAICGGNSSGGIIAIWAAAHAPELVTAVLAEDPPLFTTEWPRSREDTWVHGFFVHVVKTLPDVAGFFSTLTIPTQGKNKLMSFPKPLAWVLGGAIRRRQQRKPGAPVDIGWLPMQVRLFVRGLTEYDVDFTRACTDGRMYDMDHAACLAAIRCPLVLIQASSFRHPELGLVGAMGDDDVERAQRALPALLLEKWPVTHVVHLAAPKKYVAQIDRLAKLSTATKALPASSSRA